MVWGTYRFRKHTTLQNGKNGPKKSAPECPVECGGGGPIAIWAMPKCRVHELKWVFPKSLTLPMWQKINHRKREKMLIGAKIDDNIFCPLIAVHIIANYCRCYSMNRVSCDGSFTMHWPFTNHRSFTIDAFSWGAGPIP